MFPNSSNRSDKRRKKEFPVSFLLLAHIDREGAPEVYDMRIAACLVKIAAAGVTKADADYIVALAALAGVE
jgi:hypothetical protein